MVECMTLYTLSEDIVRISDTYYFRPCWKQSDVVMKWIPNNSRHWSSFEFTASLLLWAPPRFQIMENRGKPSESGKYK